MPPSNGGQHPSVARIASVAAALGDLSSEVVFIGGAIAPLLQTNPVLPRVRPTADVDAVVASANYGSLNALEARLRTLGFKTEIAEQKHVHRWQAPNGTLFDLVPVGAHLGGTGGEWDKVAIELSVSREVSSGVTVKHASSVGFLCLKWAAFWDRGVSDPFRSEDLEDIMALLVSRDNIVAEVIAAPRPARDYIQDGLHWLRRHPEYEDLIAAYLSHATSYSSVVVALNDRIGLVLSV